MKPLLPTLKEKKRYIVYAIHSTQPVRDCSRALVLELKKLLGLFDSAAAGLQHITFDAKKQEGVLRASTRSVPKVRAALTLIKALNGTAVRITTKGVSGILNKTERFMELKV